MPTFVKDFVMNFHVFVNLSLVVYSIVIRNIKDRWITEIDDFGRRRSWRTVVGAFAFENELTNQELRKLICG